MADDFDPAAFDAFKKAQGLGPGTAPPSADFDPAAFETFKKSQQPAAEPTSFLDEAEKGAKGLVRGAGDFVGNMGEAVMGPFGPSHHAANLMATLGLGERPAPEPGYGQQIARAAGVEDKKPGYSGSIGETLGNPASYFGPGGPLAKLIMGTVSGAGGEAAAQAAEGTGYETPARIAGSLLAGPLAARAVKPQVGTAQQTLLDSGMRQMTPGQLTGGIPKALEDRITSIPLLGSFVSNARGRSVESFNRAVGNQALEPIGEKLSARTEAGHPMVAEVEHKLDQAYNKLVPNLVFAPDKQFAFDMMGIYQRNHGLLPPEQAQQFDNIISSRIMGRGGNMTGEKIKKIEEELGKMGKNYGSSPDPAQRDLGYALSDTVKAIRGNLERVNPAQAAELRQINTGWAMYARMRDAASSTTGAGVFMPSQLLAAVRRGDKSVGHGSFSKGEALMQDFATAGQAVLPSKLPTSGTAERAMTAGLLGGVSHLTGHPGLLAAGVAATAPYTRPSQYLLNQYVAPTTGLRADYANAGRGVGSLRPFMQSNPYETP